MEEHQFIVNQFASEDPYGIWIGLNDITEEGHYSWVNGDALDFTYWAPGQPDDYHGHEDCTGLWYAYATTGFLWDDLPCGNSYAFVCKLDASGM